MKFLATILVIMLVTAFGTALGPNAVARDFLQPGDIERADTTQAIVTVATAQHPDRIRAIRFPTVPDLQSCFSLAYSAVAKAGGESSVTCINASGVVAATYFCRGGNTSPACEIVTP